MATRIHTILCLIADLKKVIKSAKFTEEEKVQILDKTRALRTYVLEKKNGKQTNN